MPNKETHRAFNQLLNTFLEINNKEEELAQDGTSSIKSVSYTHLRAHET